MKSGPVFCLLLGVSSDYAQPIMGQVTEVTCPVIGQAQPELWDRKGALNLGCYISLWTFVILSSSHNPDLPTSGQAVNVN